MHFSLEGRWPFFFLSSEIYGLRAWLAEEAPALAAASCADEQKKTEKQGRKKREVERAWLAEEAPALAAASCADADEEKVEAAEADENWRRI